MAKRPRALNRNSIYGETRWMSGEFARPRRSGIGKDSISAILDFIRDMKTSGPGVHRQYFYAVKLRVMAVKMGSASTNPGKKDIRALIDEFQEGQYADNSMEDFKVKLKRFYKWFLGKDESYSEFLNVLKRDTNGHLSRIQKPEPIISKQELRGTVAACNQPRDRALISLLHD